jgi:hypothetical protein
MIEEKKRQEEEGKRGAWNEVEIGECHVHVCLSVPVCVHVIHDHPLCFIYPGLLVAVCETSCGIRG